MDDGRSEIILKFPLACLRLCGQHPDVKKFIFITATIIMATASSIIMAMVLYHFYLAFGDPFVFLRNVGSFGVHIQIFCKVLIMAVQRNDLRILIEDTKLLWDTRNSPDKLKNIFVLLFPFTLRLQKFWVFLCMLTISLTIGQGYYTKQLPLGLWLIEGHDKYYLFHFILQSITFLYIVAFQINAIDEIFMSICIIIITQFMLLHNKIEQLDVSNINSKEDKIRYLKNISDYIRYHNLLLRIVNQLAKTFSPIMLCECVSLISALCASMLMLLDSDNTQDKVSYTFILICCFVQLSIYCILLDYIAEQAYNVSWAIYGTNWYSQYIPEVKHIILLVIQRIQKQILFQAGALFEINSRTLLVIFKIAWSICVATRTIRHQ